MRPRQGRNRKICHQCRTWWLFWWQCTTPTLKRIEEHWCTWLECKWNQKPNFHLGRRFNPNKTRQLLLLPGLLRGQKLHRQWRNPSTSVQLDTSKCKWWYVPEKCLGLRGIFVFDSAILIQEVFIISCTNYHLDTFLRKIFGTSLQYYTAAAAQQTLFKPQTKTSLLHNMMCILITGRCRK